MDYREIPAPPSLRHLAKASWTLATPGGADDWFSHIATPDGCVEIIRRLRGRSIWREEQPACFVAGLSTRPVELRLAGGSAFVALRLWPWAWAAIAAPASRTIIDGWRDLGAAAPGFSIADDPTAAFDVLDPQLVDRSLQPLIEAILVSRSVAEIIGRSGVQRRRLQRWFEQNVGVPPRTYLRLLRFNQSFESLPAAAGTLAEHAAEHGFADQAHMAREFRSLSGSPAVTAREKVRGPFLN